MSPAHVLVPGSPPKSAALGAAIERRYEEKRQDAFHGSLSRAPSTRQAEPAETGLAPPRVTSLLASSARANRAAEARDRQSSSSKARRKRFQRSEGTVFGDEAAPVPEQTGQPGDERDESLRLVESLTIGPKQVEPPPDDAHFLRLEPTSGVALRSRTCLHNDLDAHLQGRYYLAPSTLYSVAREGQSDDGDFTIPVVGDWVTMGVITRFSEPIEIKERTSERNDGANERDHGMSRKAMRAKRFVVATLTDLGVRPGKYGEQGGSHELEMTLFEADNVWRDPAGVRQYSGGSSGAFEKLYPHGLGALICLLNPKIKNVRRMHRGGKAVSSSSMFRLNPRSGDTVVIVGIASDYGCCRGVDKDGGRCQNFVDQRMKTRVCSKHVSMNLNAARNGRPELQNSWRGRTKEERGENLYSLANGLLEGPKAKCYMLNSSGGEGAFRSGGVNYDVNAHYGRVKEERSQDQDRLKELMDAQKSLSAGGEAVAHKDEWYEERLAKKLQRKRTDDALARAPSSDAMTKLGFTMYESGGTRAIEAVKRARLAQKQHQLSKGTTAVQRIDRCQENTGMPSGSYRAPNGDMKVLSSSSSRLLARHSAKSSLLPKPLLRRKKVPLPPAVKPPPGESFYASESSDEELDEIMRSGALVDGLRDSPMQPSPCACTDNSDSDSDLEIIPA